MAKKSKVNELNDIPASTPFSQDENTELIRKHGYPISIDLRGLMVSSAKLVLEKSIEIGDTGGILRALKILIEMNSQNTALVRIGKDQENAKILAEAQKKEMDIVVLIAKLIPDPNMRISIIERIQNGSITEQEITGFLPQGRDGFQFQSIPETSLECDNPGNSSGVGEAPRLFLRAPEPLRPEAERGIRDQYVDSELPAGSNQK